ncbi:MAG: ATPase, partial [Okeania sp. SIO2D1]|nr:ATPase [Okeania sp. SIO2D1]
MKNSPKLNLLPQSFLALLILTGLGYLGNYFKLELFFGVDFLFGSIAVMMVVSFYGIFWGTLVGLIVSSHTYILWAHPYAIIIFTCEACFVAFFLRRRRQNMVFLDSLYWVLIGIPLVGLFYGAILPIPLQGAIVIALKQAIN